MPSKTKELSLAEAKAALEKAHAAVEAAKAQAQAVESEVEPTVVKEATVVEEKKIPTSGQSAPPGNFPFETLNEKERAVVKFLNGTGHGARKTTTIAALAAECFFGEAETEAQANSWVRNSLRRLVRGGWVDKPSRGQYRVSTKGRKQLKS